MKEYWDIYDESRRPTGRTAVRGSRLGPGEYHLVVHVCLFNGKGELLIQQRQPFKSGWPGMWDVSVGGSALAGETSLRAAARETREELGYGIKTEGLRAHLTVNFEEGFDDFYLITAPDLSPRALRLQEEEVRNVRWATLEEIHGLIKRGDFIPYYPGLIDSLFQMRESRGSFPT